MSESDIEETEVNDLISCLDEDDDEDFESFQSLTDKV
jgi:hypothetical protein